MANPKILVVDDEPDVVMLIEATLRGDGFDVVKAYDGIGALDLVTSEKPDLILLDIMMPRMDGTEVRKRLLADPATADIPVIHLSAVGDFEKQHQALAEGVTDYIVKPFTPSDLAQRVADMLDPKKREQVQKERDHKSAQLRTMTDIMARKRESGK